jgi:hypothetical protein
MKREGAFMTIEITKPEVEALITQRLQSGVFKDAEDVILQALKTSPPAPASTPTKDIEELFAPLRGTNLDFTRNPSTGRQTDL